MEVNVYDVVFGAFLTNRDFIVTRVGFELTTSVLQTPRSGLKVEGG